MWKSRRWRKLLNILEHLPRTSAYAQAMATDEELAAEVAKLPESDRTAKWSRSYRDYSPEVEMLSALFDRLGELVRVTAAMRGGRGKQPQFAPRPESAIERVRRRLAQDQHKRLTDRLIRKPAR
jgi:hypothetical protein